MVGTMTQGESKPAELWAQLLDPDCQRAVKRLLPPSLWKVVGLVLTRASDVLRKRVRP